MEDKNSTDNVQRALNEHKKLELKEKFGGEFHTNGPDLPPDIEAEWLNQIDEFERAFAYAEEIPVREFLGNPAVIPPDQLPPELLEKELDRIFEIISSNQIEISFLREVPDAEKYRFITEELFGLNIENIRIPGMIHGFIYEEFHPDDEADSKSAVEHFLRVLFLRDLEAVGRTIAEGMKSDIALFYDNIAAFTHWDVSFTTCEVTGDLALVGMLIIWDGLRNRTMEPVAASGVAEFRLKRSSYGDWEIVQARVPGWNLIT